MWKSLKESEYYLLFSTNYGYEICLTDYFIIWTAVFSEKAFLAQLKKSNDDLELENDNEFIKKGVYLLSNPEKLKKFTSEKKDDGNSLFITMKISFGFPFNFECKLSKGSDELYFQKITQPLLKTIGDLRASQSELRRLLIKKDNEIEEYKCDGGEIVLRHLKTVAFNDEEHMKKHSVYEENFGTHDIPTSLIGKTVDLPQQSILKQESSDKAKELKQNIKTEPKSELSEESSTSVNTASVSCKQEAIKSETKPTHRAGLPRKRSRFNF